MRRRLLLPLLALGSLTFASSATAAYRPAWSFSLSDTRPATAPALSSTLTQAPGESASRRVAVRYPPEFGFNPGFSVAGCTAAQEQADACPESSRIGTTRAVTALGAFSGPVYLTEDFRLLSYLRGLGVIGQKFEGKLYLGADGSVETVFDDLPNFQATVAEIAVEGGRRGILLTPRRCGRYTLTGTFASHAGDRVTRTVPVDISGCSARPVISRLRARPRRFRRRTILSWQLSQPAARSSVSVQRLGRRGWRELRTLSASGRIGRNSLRLSGRRLRPGRYRFVVRATGRGGMLSRSQSVRARRLR
jgi:hypothetical protein